MSDYILESLFSKKCLDILIYYPRCQVSTRWRKQMLQYIINEQKSDNGLSGVDFRLLDLQSTCTQGCAQLS